MTASEKQTIDIKPELITRLKQRDESALAELIEEQKGLLHYWAFQILKNEADADEVVSDTFNHIWKKIDLYDPEKGGLAGLGSEYRSTCCH